MIRVAHLRSPDPPLSLSSFIQSTIAKHQNTQYYDFDARDDSYLDDEGAWLLLCCCSFDDDAYECGND